MHWPLPDRVLTIGRRPLVMGIVNVTPDSFSDGGQHAATAAAIAHGLALVENGADILDIGGESTRPGSQPVPLEDELRRVVPVVAGLVGQVAVPISVDTSKAEVARQCLALGARIINDVTALRGDADMTAIARDSQAAVVLMHMQGTPATMQTAPHYDDVVADIYRFFEERLHELTAAGIAAERVALDPGIGFGKTQEHNLAILARLEEFQRLGRPVCLGVSRKGLLSKLVGGGRPVDQRLAGSLAVACWAACRGSAQMVRVHDVRETADALKVIEALSPGD